jgi:methylmalonyl-CoA/ethylmalonyl-CoA epimerase
MIKWLKIGESMIDRKSSAPLLNSVLCQVGFVVKNADTLAANFSKAIGLEIPPAIITDTFDKAHTEFRGAPSSARAKLIIFNLGQVSIEIIEPIGGPSTWSEFLETNGEGVHHIAFTVPDANLSAAGLAGMGIPAIQSGVFEGGKYIYSDGKKVLGVILELLEFNSH